jgi:hypothetical protein
LTPHLSRSWTFWHEICNLTGTVKKRVRHRIMSNQIFVTNIRTRTILFLKNWLCANIADQSIFIKSCIFSCIKPLNKRGTSTVYKSPIPGLQVTKFYSSKTTSFSGIQHHQMFWVTLNAILIILCWLIFINESDTVPLIITYIFLFDAQRFLPKIWPFIHFHLRWQLKH